MHMYMTYTYHFSIYVYVQINQLSKLKPAININGAQCNI